MVFNSVVMSESERDVSSSNGDAVSQTTKKKKVTGRMQEVKQKLLASSHEVGQDCRCKRLKCFQNVSKIDQQHIINRFNSLMVNEQNNYLAGLINVNSISQRRPRQPEDIAKLHDCSYSYRVRVKKQDCVEDIAVCFKAFQSLHGISKKKVEVIQRYVKAGVHPVDGRGKHTNRPHALSKEVKDAVIEHIGSFKGEKAHYCLKDSKKTYLPSELNFSKMHKMFKDKYPLYKVSYEKYRTVCNNNFNISFGYPRQDTCSSCDQYAAEVRSIEEGLKVFSEESEEKAEALKKLKTLSNENKLHLMKANMFYIRKRESRLSSQKSNDRESIAMDYQKNLPTPNITTNDVYYKRQLTVCMFNIHVLSTNESFFYAYDETVANKGADEVCSFLYYYIMTKLDSAVRVLDIFCDSCAGQNKNWSLFRLIHYVVHHAKRLDKVQLNFPIRGHSYLECDRNMACINQKKWIEIPSEWFEEFENARAKPSPFRVIEVDKELVRKWTEFLDEHYLKKCPFKSRPIRELIAVKQHPRLLKYRNSYFGHWDGYVVNRPGSVPQEKDDTLLQGEFVLPGVLYEGRPKNIILLHYYLIKLQ